MPVRLVPLDGRSGSSETNTAPKAGHDRRQAAYAGAQGPSLDAVIFRQEDPGSVLSNLLWAAFGINRADGRRTAPSARNWQEIDLYLCLTDGVYLYSAADHSLLQLSAEDLRAKTGVQDFVATAPLNIVYVADGAKLKTQSADDAALYMGADCGVIVQNVYLYCASEGLGTVIRAMVDRPSLARAMKLRDNQKIVLSQTVGYPR